MSSTVKGNKQNKLSLLTVKLKENGVKLTYSEERTLDRLRFHWENNGSLRVHSSFLEPTGRSHS